MLWHMSGALLVLSRLFRLVFVCFFDRNVLKLFRIKNFAAFKALDELCIVVPGNDSYARMFAGGWHRIEFN